MADSVLFYLSGDRVIDANGVAVSGATLHFFDAGTTDPRTVYQDKDLVTPHSASIATTSGGQVPEIWLGTGNYKVDIRDSGGTSIAGYPRDNRKGALDTSGFSTTYAFREEPAISVTATSYTLLAANLGKVHDCNPSGGDIAFTLLDAVTAGDGAVAIIRHVGSSGNVAITAPSSQIGPITLTRIGQSVTVTSNGATWRISAEAAGLFINRTPIINLVDRQTAPPSSPAAGSRYLINGTPTGAWASFAANDIVEYHAVAGWQRYTPAKGWRGYLEDDNYDVVFNGTSWVDWSNTAATTTSTLKVAVFEDQKATNTGGGSASTIQKWLTRTLNTQVSNSITGLSLSSNQLTIPAGTYAFDAAAPFFDTSYSRLRLFHIKKAGTFTVTIASPGVVTCTAHGLSNGDEFIPATSGALPTGMTAGTSYYVINKTDDTFQFAASPGGTAINTSGSQSGTHTLSGGAELGVSPNSLAETIANVETYISFSGSFTLSASATVELQYIIQGSGTLGNAHNFTGMYERYARLRLIDLSSIQGPQGVAGATGATGVDGLDAAYPYQWSTSTSGDPGSGKIAGNNATIASITQIAISETDSAGGSMSAVIATWDDSTSSVRALLKISKEGQANNFHAFRITGAGTDQGSYWTFPVNYVATSGSVANNDNCAVLVVERGDKGDPGVTVPDITGLTSLNARDVASNDLAFVYDTSASALKSFNIYSFSQRGTRNIEEYFTAYGGADDGSADCAAAINAAITDCATNGYTLRTRPGTYRCDSSITLASNLKWELDGRAAHIKRQYASASAATFLLRSHANFSSGSPLTNVVVTGGRWGATDGVTYPGGAMFLWLDDSRFSDFWITKFGDEYARFGAQAFNWGGTRFIVTRAHITGPQEPAADIATLYPDNTPWGGSGGMRFFGGSDSHALHCYVESGDDALQFVPIISSTAANHANLDIIGCTYTACTAKSYGGRPALIAYGGVLPSKTYTWNTATSGDPGSGQMRGNNATLASITEIAISETTGGTPADYSADLATWGAGTVVRVQRTGSNLIVVRLTGSGTDLGTYRTFPATVVHTLGTPAGGTSTVSYTSLTGKIQQAFHIACALEGSNANGIGYMIQNEVTTGTIEDSGCIATRLSMFDQTASANLGPLSILQTAGTGGVIRPRADITIYNPYNKLADITAEETDGIRDPDIVVNQADRTDSATIVGLIDVENVVGGRIRGTIKANATETAIRVGASSKTVRGTAIGPFRIEHAANTGSNINIINLQTTQDVVVDDVTLYPDSGDATTRVFVSSSTTGALFRRLDASRLGISFETRLNNAGVATRFENCVGVDETDPYIVLTDAASISWDMSRGTNYMVTLGGNRALANPTNERVGSSGFLLVKQDGTGGRTLSFGTHYVTSSSPNSAANAVTVYAYTVENTNTVHLSQVKTYSQASETAQGIVELATTAEATTGTDTERAVTPAGVTAAMAAYAQPLDSDLTAIAAISSSGLIARTGAGTAQARTITAGAGATVTNGSGASGNPTVAVDFGHTELVASTSLTGSSVSAAIAGGYSELMVIITQASHNDGSSQQLRVEFSMDGGSTYPLVLNFGLASTAAQNINGVVRVSGYARTTSAPKVGVVELSNVNTAQTLSFVDTTADAIDYIRLSPAAGSWDGGSFRVLAR